MDSAAQPSSLGRLCELTARDLCILTSRCAALMAVDLLSVVRLSVAIVCGLSLIGPCPVSTVDCQRQPSRAPCRRVGLPPPLADPGRSRPPGALSRSLRVRPAGGMAPRDPPRRPRPPPCLPGEGKRPAGLLVTGRPARTRLSGAELRVTGHGHGHLAPGANGSPSEHLVLTD